MLSGMDGTWASIKSAASLVWGTRAGLVGAIVFVGSAIFGLANLVGLMGDLSATWELFKDWLPVVGFFVATAAFFRAADEAKRHSDAKEQATKAVIDGLHKRYDERTSSLQEKIKENHRRELEELSRWSEMATQIADIARRYRLIAAVRESRENLRKQYAECEWHMSATSPNGMTRIEANTMKAVEQAVKSLAVHAAHIDRDSRYPINKKPLDSDINAARAPHEEKLAAHSVTYWRTIWLQAHSAMDAADRLCAELDAETMRMEVNLVQNVAVRTAT